ncbi:Sulfhydryl oxidase 1 [Asimina triloba]
MSSTLLLLFFFSVVLRFGASKSLLPDIETLRSPSRSLLRAINDLDPVDAVVDLNATNFDQVLRESPSSFAVVEFFANWCPACRNYKPHYEKVARLFNGRNAVHPGIVVMTRVDCALKVTRAVYDVEEATAEAFDIILEHKVGLIIIYQTWKDPPKSWHTRCRRGSADILVNFDYLWPSDLWSVGTQEAVISHEKDALKSLRICGKEVPRGYWLVKEENPGVSAMDRKFVINDTTRDFAMWLWNAHNKVNERLMKEEAALQTGDPKYPKMMWPPKQLCPSCYLSPTVKVNGTIRVDWNKEEVFKFLVGYYGKMLVSSFKEYADTGIDSSKFDGVAISTTGLSSTVPFGAALGIALACCAFGMLACLWRSQQKSRKPRRSRNGDFPKVKPGDAIN